MKRLSAGCKRAAVDQPGHTSPNEFHLPWTSMEDPATALTEVKVAFFHFLEGNKEHVKSQHITLFFLFLVADKRLYKRLCPSVRWSVGPLVCRSVVIELESVKTRISAPAHPSATGIGRVSGLVLPDRTCLSFYRQVPSKSSTYDYARYCKFCQIV